MTDAVLIVESKPESPDKFDAYLEWYEQTHVPEVLAIEGFVSARLLESLERDSLVAMFELEANVDVVKANLRAAQKSGALTRPQHMQLDPPPSTRYFVAKRDQT